MAYFLFGMCLTLGLNSWLTQIADHLVAALISILGGMASAIAVAWVKHRWERRK